MASDGQLRLTVVRRGQGRPRLNDEERKENAEWDKATRRGNSASKKVQEEAVIDTLVTEALAASRHLTCNRTDSSSNLERSESVDNWLHCQRIQQSRRTNSVPSSGNYVSTLHTMHDRFAVQTRMTAQGNKGIRQRRSFKCSRSAEAPETRCRPGDGLDCHGARVHYPVQDGDR